MSPLRTTLEFGHEATDAERGRRAGRGQCVIACLEQEVSDVLGRERLVAADDLVEVRALRLTDSGTVNNKQDRSAPSAFTGAASSAP